MKWSLRTYNLLVNEKGEVLKLVRGTWRHPEKVVVVASGMSEKEERSLVYTGLNHVTHHIVDLEKTLFQKLDAKKRASRSVIQQLATLSKQKEIAH